MSAYEIRPVGGGYVVAHRSPGRAVPYVVALFDNADRALDALLDLRALEALPCVR